MPDQSQVSPVFVRLARHPMLPGGRGWPTTADRRQSAQAALRQALVDVLDAEGQACQPHGQTAADAVAAALLNAFGNGRWTLRSAPGSAEILGKF